MEDSLTIFKHPTELKMHSVFLERIRAQRAELEAELARLRAVEEYHDGEVRRLGGSNVSSSSSLSSSSSSSSSASSSSSSCRSTPSGMLDLAKELRGKTKHDAAEIVLRRIGHPLRVPQIIEAMQSAGYGVELERRILHNSLYTAMDRKPEVFKKADKRWALVEWDANGSSLSSNSDG